MRRSKNFWAWTGVVVGISPRIIHNPAPECWSVCTSTGKRLKHTAKKYSELLNAIRANHPETPIYCITLLYTKKPTSEKTGFTADQFRETLAGLVKSRQASDPNLHLVKGDAITSAKNLRADNPKDPVHLGVEGAAMLADALFPMIEKGNQ